MKIRLTTYLLLVGFISPAAFSSEIENCLREYEARYNEDSNAGEPLPPMRNLYPDWEDDCQNGGAENEKAKRAMNEIQHIQKNAALATGFQGKWAMQQDLSLSLAAHLPAYGDWMAITSTTDHKVNIQNIIVNKGRCEAVYYPAYLLQPTTKVDYGHQFKVAGRGCVMHEVSIVTDIGTTTITLP